MNLPVDDMECEEDFGLYDNQWYDDCQYFCSACTNEKGKCDFCAVVYTKFVCQKVCLRSRSTQPMTPSSWVHDCACTRMDMVIIIVLRIKCATDSPCTSHLPLSP